MFKSATKFLEYFDTAVKQVNTLSIDPMPVSQNNCYLKTAASDNGQMLQAWTTIDAINPQDTNASTAITYDRYQTYLMSTATLLEGAIIDKSTGQKVNAAKPNYLEPYTPADLFYVEATELKVLKGERDLNVDALQDFWNINRHVRRVILNQ